MVDTWNILSPLFHWMGVQIPESNVRSILGNEYHLPMYISKLWRTDTNAMTALSSIRKSQLETHLQVSDSSSGITRQGVSDKQLLLQSLQAIQAETIQILSTNYTDPDKLIHGENVCLIVVFTLLRDRWYENKLSTKQRNPNVRYVYIVWMLMLAHRYKRRQCTFATNRAYKGHHFFGFVESDEQGDSTPILDWEPWRVYSAMISLDTKYIRSMDLFDDELVGKMFLLRDLLLDRCSIIAFEPINGTPDNLMRDYVLWMKCKDTNTDNGEDSTDKQDLAEFIDMDILQRLKDEKKFKEQNFQESSIYDPSTEKREKLLSETLRSNKDFLVDYMKNIVTHEKENMKNTLKTLNKLKLKYDEMLLKYENSAEAPTSLLEANVRNNYNILQVESLLAKIEHMKNKNVSEEEANKLEEMRKRAIASIIKGQSAGQSDRLGKRGTFYACAPWFIDNVYPALSLYKWQRLTISLELTSTIRHSVLKQRLLKDALYNMTIVDPVTLSERVKNWIIRLETTSMRREIYRHRTNYKSTFPFFSAWRQIYHNHAIEINKFPTTMEKYLDVDHPFHYSALSLIGYDFISQHFPKIEIDTSIFFWDIEDEYLTLERTQLRYPFMCQVGANWAIYDPPTEMLEDQWSDDRTGMLRVTPIGKDFFDCLTQFCLLSEKRKWRIEQRIGNKELDLSLSALARITKDTESSEDGTYSIP